MFNPRHFCFSATHGIAALPEGEYVFWLLSDPTCYEMLLEAEAEDAIKARDAGATEFLLQIRTVGGAVYSPSVHKAEFADMFCKMQIPVDTGAVTVRLLPLPLFLVEEFGLIWNRVTETWEIEKF